MTRNEANDLMLKHMTVTSKPVQMKPAQFDVILEDELDICRGVKGTCRVWFNFMGNIDDNLTRRDFPDIVCITFDRDSGKRDFYDWAELHEGYRQRVEDSVIEAFESGDF